MGAMFVDEKQQQQPLVMGCYGIGVSRLVATTIEQHHDDNGIRWPMSLAPYQVHLVTIGKDEGVVAAARALYDSLGQAGVEVLWDDRDERPGVKFKDADLIGIPLRVTIGAKGLAAGHVELKARTEADPKKAELMPLAQAASVMAERVKAAKAAPAGGPRAPRRARPERERLACYQRVRCPASIVCRHPRPSPYGRLPSRSRARRRSASRAAPGGPTIAARIHAPPGAGRAVVICHPHPLYGGSMHSPVPLALAKVLSDEVRDRVAWARFDFRGVGESEGPTTTVAARSTTPSPSSKSCGARPRTRPLSVCGHSFGSWVGLLAAPRRARRPAAVDRVLLLAPSVRFESREGPLRRPAAVDCLRRRSRRVL